MCKRQREREREFDHFVKSFCLVKLDVEVAVCFSLPLFLWLSVHHSVGDVFLFCYICSPECRQSERAEEEWGQNLLTPVWSDLLGYEK